MKYRVPLSNHLKKPRQQAIKRTCPGKYRIIDRTNDVLSLRPGYEFYDEYGIVYRAQNSNIRLDNELDRKYWINKAGFEFKKASDPGDNWLPLNNEPVAEELIRLMILPQSRRF